MILRQVKIKGRERRGKLHTDGGSDGHRGLNPRFERNK